MNWQQTVSLGTARLRLVIGGTGRAEGWTNYNIAPGPDTDIVGTVTDMAQVADGAAECVYVSHVLEHLGYLDELPRALRELRRVLMPGGRLMVSVPDFQVLCWMYGMPHLTPEHRYRLMRIMFGGQTDPHDFHKAGLSGEMLVPMLVQAGFADVVPVDSFDEFEDSSKLEAFGMPISLNLEARRP